MWQIPVYKQEVSDGVAEKVQACASLAYHCRADKAILEAPPAFVQKLQERATAENRGQMDLYYLKTVLASTGWNLNDDVFDRAEVWAARNTPEDKPFNYGHDENDILGHITSSYIFDDEQKVLADVKAVDALPAKFHVATGAVLYRYKSDDKVKDRIEKLIAEIEEGKWFVSMECLFTNFDYAIIEPDGTQKVIARNEQTAFLTKQLRTYGGTGKYDGKSIGRLMRNFIFSAVALVKTPANTASIIFEKTNAFVISPSTTEKAPIVLGYKSLTQNNKESIAMTDLELQNEIAQLKADKAQLEIKLKEHDAKAVASLQDLAKTQADKIAAVEAEKATLTKALEDGKKASDEITAKHASVTAAFEKLQLEQKLIKRTEHVVATLNVSKEQATTLVSQLATLTDEVFEAAIAAMPKIVAPATPAPVVTPEGNPAAIATAEPVVEPALAVATETDGKLEKTLAEIKSWYLDEKEADAQ